MADLTIKVLGEVMGGGLCLVPITLRCANNFVEAHHRHNGRTSRDGGKWAVAVAMGEVVVGVAIVGNPLSATLMDGWTAEATRVCVLDLPTVTDGNGKTHAASVCSMLYAACWRSWKAMGGRRMVTYTLQSEDGASLRAAGWCRVAETSGCSPNWNKRDHLSAARVSQAIYGAPKWRWEIKASGELSEVNPARNYEPALTDDNLGLFAEGGK